MKHINLVKKFVNDNQNNSFEYEPLPEDRSINHCSHWILTKARAAWLKLIIDAPYAEMLAEARALKERFVVHRDDQSEGWRSLSIHGVASHVTKVPEMH